MSVCVCVCVWLCVYRTYEYWKFPCGSMSELFSRMVASTSAGFDAGAATATANKSAKQIKNFILMSWVFCFWLLVHLWLAEELIECDANGCVSTALYTNVSCAIVKRANWVYDGCCAPSLYFSYVHANMNEWVSEQVSERACLCACEREWERKSARWWCVATSSVRVTFSLLLLSSCKYLAIAIWMKC